MSEGLQMLGEGGGASHDPDVQALHEMAERWGPIDAAPQRASDAAKVEAEREIRQLIALRTCSKRTDVQPGPVTDYQWMCATRKRHRRNWPANLNSLLRQLQIEAQLHGGRTPLISRQLTFDRAENIASFLTDERAMRMLRAVPQAIPNLVLAFNLADPVTDYAALGGGLRNAESDIKRILSQIACAAKRQSASVRVPVSEMCFIIGGAFSGRWDLAEEYYRLVVEFPGCAQTLWDLEYYDRSAATAEVELTRILEEPSYGDARLHAAFLMSRMGIGHFEALVDRAPDLDPPVILKRLATAAGDDGLHPFARRWIRPVQRPPSNKAWMAWRIRNLMGKTQTEVAKLMTQKGYPVSQGHVSRLLARVEQHVGAGGHPPSMQDLPGRPQFIAPSVIDLGQRRDGRSRHQRESRDTIDDR